MSLPPYRPYEFNYDTLMKKKETNALTTNELIFLTLHDPGKTPNTDEKLIKELQSHHTGTSMNGFINDKIAREYLNKYNNTMVELQNKLSGLSVLEKEKNNMRQMMSNVHGINSDEEIDESEGATGYRKDQQTVEKQIEELEKEMKQYFISENNASLAELMRFYNLKPIHGGKRGRTHRRRNSKTRRSKKARHLTRHRR